MSTKTNNQDFSNRTKLFIVLGTVLLVVLGYFGVQAIGETRIGLTLMTNPNLKDGLVAHWTFDGEDMDWDNKQALDIVPASDEIYGEAGTFTSTTDGTWTTINFNNTYNNPVIVGTVNSTSSDGTGMIFEARSVASSSAQMRICEQVATISSDGCQSLSASETVGYLVIDASDVGDISGVDAGTYSNSGNVDGGTTAVSFNESFGSTPIVLTSVQTVDGGDPIEARAWSVSTSGFTGSICHQNAGDGCDSGHGSETVGWIAVEPGNIPFLEDTDSGTASGLTDNSWSTQTFSTSFSVAPVVIADIQTNNGAQESEVTEARNVTVGGVDVRYCEVESDSSCDTHTTEDVSWFAAAAGDLTTAGSGNNGDLKGGMAATSSPATGRLGQALEFDGSDDRVKIADGRFSDATSGSIAFWFNLSSADSGTSFLGYGTDADVATNCIFTIEINTATPSLRIFQRSEGGPVGAAINVDTAFSLNTWHHGVITSDGSEYKVYMDGSESSLTVANGSNNGNWFGDTTCNTGNGETLVGALLADGSYKFTVDGSLDDFHIYNRALSASEVTRLYGLGATTRINKTITTNPDLNTGLIGHWTMDGKNMINNVSDVSGSGHDAKLRDDTSTTTAPGRIGQAFDFDGDTAAFFPDDSSIRVNHFTISAWIYSRSAGNHSVNDQPIITKGSAPYSWYFTASNRTVNIYHEGPGDWLSGSTQFALNQWQHVVATWDGATRKVWLNGVEDGSVADTTDTSYSAKDVHIGQRFDDVTNFFDGLIDDVRIYNRALSASEIQRLYELGATTRINKTLATNPDLSSGLVGHWSFDGPTMYSNIGDSSGQGNNGKLQGQTSTTTTPGRIGQALDFDGSDDYVTTDSTGVSGTAARAVSFWFKTTSTVTADDMVIAWGGSASGDSGAVYRVSVENGVIFVRVYGDAPSWGSGYNDGEWHHVVVQTPSGGTTADTRVYVDGVDLGLGSGTTAIDTRAGSGTYINVQIGQDAQGGGGRNFDGQIDDVRIYNRVLSASEVKRLYELGR